MKIQLLGRIGLCLAAACLLFAASGAAAAQKGGVRSVDFGGVTLSYDASLAGAVEGKFVPETIERGDIAWWMAMPQHLEFTFTNFHGSGGNAPAPVIYVFPVLSDYKHLAPDVSYNIDTWLPNIEHLKSLLAEQPDLTKYVTTAPSAPSRLPYLPPINAVIYPIGKLGYFSFGNGAGVGYLAHGSQDVAPPDRSSTFYTFQGLTSDGKFYVAGLFPAFPTSMKPIEMIQGTDVWSYYLGMIYRFDAISNDAYAPNLDLLDKMMGSLSVEPTVLGGLPGMPKTGASEQAAGLLAIGATLLIATGLFLMRRRRWV